MTRGLLELSQELIVRLGSGRDKLRPLESPLVESLAEKGDFGAFLPSVGFSFVEEPLEFGQEIRKSFVLSLLDLVEYIFSFFYLIRVIENTN